MIIFDCDGVLVDSEALVIEVESEMLTEAGFPITAADIARRFTGLSYSTMMEGLAEQFGRPIPRELSLGIQDAALARFPDRLQPIPGIAPLLSASSERRCVASSSDVDRIHLALDCCDLRHFFADDSIFSAQMVERGKPAPDLFLHAAHAMEVDPKSCLVVEDSPPGVEAAVSAGMQVVGLTAGGHVQPGHAERLRTSGASEVFADTEQLGHYIRARGGKGS